LVRLPFRSFDEGGIPSRRTTIKSTKRDKGIRSIKSGGKLFNTLSDQDVLKFKIE